MKKTLLLAMLSCAALVPGGCSGQADEDMTPDQVRQEIRSMSAAGIRARADAFRKAAAARRAELEAEGEKLAKLPPDRQLGDEADRIRARMRALDESIRKLTANMNVCAEGIGTAK